MVRVIFPPICTVVAGVNTRTGATVAPVTCDARVMDVKAVIAVGLLGSDVISAASFPAVKVVSVLDDILKPSVTAV